MLKIYRYASDLRFEQIQIITENVNRQKRVISDKTLRAKSFTYYDENGNVNKTSESKIPLDSNVVRILIKSRNTMFNLPT
jgi:hypothetical protein